MPESYKWPIAIRTDASIQIGTGHVMRCLALASVLRDKGAEICFLCRELNGNLTDFIKNQGYSLYESGIAFNPLYLILDNLLVGVKPGILPLFAIGLSPSSFISMVISIGRAAAIKLPTPKALTPAFFNS